MKQFVLVAALAVSASAGPFLSCRTWISTPGSTFEALEGMRARAVTIDDSPADRRAAIEKLAALKAQIRQGDAMSYLRAGYWGSILQVMGMGSVADGPELVRQAAELRPNDAEFQFFAALGYFEVDKAEFRKYWDKAQRLAQPGSAVARNLKLYGEELTSRVH